MALPALEAMTPSLKAAGAKAAPQRLVCVGNPYGMIPQRFFPKQAGQETGRLARARQRADRARERDRHLAGDSGRVDSGEYSRSAAFAAADGRGAFGAGYSRGEVDSGSVEEAPRESDLF